MTAPPDPIATLWRERPRNRFVTGSLCAFGALLIGAWIVGDFGLGEVWSQRRADNLARFANEIRPRPLRDLPWDHGVALQWAKELLDDRGWAALRSTLAISILAIVLATLLGVLAALPAARNLATSDPFLPLAARPSRLRTAGWRALTTTTRVGLTFVRSLPEYIWAFLFVAMLGPNAWPAVLALALHNAGILGRLYAESIENLDPRAPAALRGLGARRLQIAAVALGPALLPRLLLYFFYRWETCVREATMLGMLGIVSLGYWIADARTRGQYDSFVFLIALGAAIVLIGDLVSAAVRRLVRA